MKRILIIVTLLASLISSYAYAEVYSYTGTKFTNIRGVLHTTDMRVTGAFVTSSPIPPNSDNFDISGIVTSWSFNDGVQTINSSNGVIYPSNLLIVSTDGLGDITEIDIQVFVAPIGTAIDDTDDFIWISYFGFDLVDIGAVCTEVINGICTSWPFMEHAHTKTEGVWMTSPGNPDLGIKINPGLNDAWYNPATSGQGFFITVFPDLGYVSLAWFTYDTELPPEDAITNLGDPGHRWLTAGGPIDGNKVLMNIELTSGGIFDTATLIDRTDPPGSDGKIILTFDSCNSGTVEYDIPSIGRVGTVPIRRVANDNVALCEALSTD